MRLILALSFCAVAAAYLDMDDGVNVEKVIEDIPLFRSNLNCFLDKGPCTKPNAVFKKHFSEVVDDGCRECNVRERHMFHIFLNGLQKNLPEEYKEFRAKYDPSGVHFDAAAAAVQKY